MADSNINCYPLLPDDVAWTFAEWYVRFGGKHYLDGLEETEAANVVQRLLKRSNPSGRRAPQGSVWLRECSPGCICHEDCTVGRCIHGAPPRDNLTGRPEWIFATRPEQAVPLVKSGRGRALSAGAEGSGGGVGWGGGEWP